MEMGRVGNCPPLIFMGKSILINRNGAYGDLIHVSFLPRLLKDNGYDRVGFSTGYKGLQILKYNPFIDDLHFFELGDRKISREYYESRLRILRTKYDDYVDLNCCIEENLLAMERQNCYYQHISVRRKMGEVNYYDVATDLIGFPELKGKYRGEVFYTPEDIAIVENDLLRPGRFKDSFKVMINLGGSGPHKMFLQAREVVSWILDTYPDAVVFTTGGKEVEELDLTDLGDRVHSIVGKKGFRQALLMMKYMDCAVGCESGIMCGASMWDIPTIQLMTCASLLCHTKYTTKDYSLQSPARCSPCYKGPYKYYGCPKKNGSPLCVFFDVEKIKTNIARIYDEQYLLSRVTDEVESEVSSVR
jgi:ADP-heptose:LPS heptosyltransferase